MEGREFRWLGECRACGRPIVWAQGRRRGQAPRWVPVDGSTVDFADASLSFAWQGSEGIPIFDRQAGHRSHYSSDCKLAAVPERDAEALVVKLTAGLPARLETKAAEQHRSETAAEAQRLGLRVVDGGKLR